MFYDQYLKACELHGKSPTSLLYELGISKSLYTNWKKGGEPLNSTKKKIVAYFGITVHDWNQGEYFGSENYDAECVDNSMQNIGERIKSRRCDLNLTQRDLGEKLGVLPQTIYK